MPTSPVQFRRRNAFFPGMRRKPTGDRGYRKCGTPRGIPPDDDVASACVFSEADLKSARDTRAAARSMLVVVSTTRGGPDFVEHPARALRRRRRPGSRLCRRAARPPSCSVVRDRACVSPAKVEFRRRRWVSAKRVKLKYDTGPKVLLTFPAAAMTAK